MKRRQFTVGIFGVALIFLLALGGCPDNGDDNKKDELKMERVGDDEVKGKTFYVGSSYKTVFSADGTFETYNIEADYINETWEEVFSAKGSYGYNSETKTVTVAVPQVDAKFVIRIFKYEITPDGSLLGQEVHTSNGTDEFKGNTYTLPSMFGWSDTAGTPYVFASSGNTYSFTSTQGYDKNGDPIDTVTSGTYYYDSDQKTVLLCPTLLNAKTMAEFYDICDPADYFGPLTAPADKKAAQTNYNFNGEELTYDPATKTLDRKYGGWF
jgi:hypothetical protein